MGLLPTLFRPRAGVCRDHGIPDSALAVLLRADEYARETLCDRWQFAVELRTLRQEGMADNELRWLLSKGYAVQGVETTRHNDCVRSFCQVTNYALDSRSCFLLTDIGVTALGGHTSRFDRVHLLDETDAIRDIDIPNDRVTPVSVEPVVVRFATVPSWDAMCRTLLLGRQVVKRFRQPARCQVTIITAFQEEEWSYRIDDPLPPCSGLDSKRRLHDTINNLNRHQQAALVRFLGDGTGRGVCWRLTEEHERTEEDPP